MQRLHLAVQVLREDTKSFMYILYILYIFRLIFSEIFKSCLTFRIESKIDAMPVRESEAFASAWFLVDNISYSIPTYKNKKKLIMWV